MFRLCMCRARGGATREYLCKKRKGWQTPGGASFLRTSLFRRQVNTVPSCCWDSLQTCCLEARREVRRGTEALPGIYFRPAGRRQMRSRLAMQRQCFSTTPPLEHNSRKQ